MLQMVELSFYLDAVKQKAGETFVLTEFWILAVESWRAQAKQKISNLLIYIYGCGRWLTLN